MEEDLALGSSAKEKQVLMMEKENEALRSELRARTPHQAISGRDGAPVQNQHGELDEYNETLKQARQREAQLQVWGVVNDVAAIRGGRGAMGRSRVTIISADYEILRSQIPSHTVLLVIWYNVLWKSNIALDLQRTNKRASERASERMEE